jgi:hypothetical protein
MAYFYLFIIKKLNLFKYIFSCAGLLLGVAMPILKYFSAVDGWELGGAGNVDEYIAAQYSNEADDFSLILPVLASITKHGWPYPFQMIILIGLIITGLLIHRNLKKYEEQKLALILSASTLSIFSAVSFIEQLYLAGSRGGLISTLSRFPMEFIINSQLGVKVTSLISINLITVILSCSKCFQARNSCPKADRSVSALFLLVSASCLLVGKNQYSEVNFLSDIYTPANALSAVSERNWAGVKSYNFCNQTYITDLPKYNQNNLDINAQLASAIMSRRSPAGDEDSYTPFNSVHELVAFAQWIRSNAPEKVITPPYLPCIRELIFPTRTPFQEHDDGNLTLGSRRLYERTKTRMALYDVDYLKMPYRESGLDLSYIFKLYNEMSEANLRLMSELGYCVMIIQSNYYKSMHGSVISRHNEWGMYDICERD